MGHIGKEKEKRKEKREGLQKDTESAKVSVKFKRTERGVEVVGSAGMCGEAPVLSVFDFVGHALPLAKLPGELSCTRPSFSSLRSIHFRHT